LVRSNKLEKRLKKLLENSPTDSLSGRCRKSSHISRCLAVFWANASTSSVILVTIDNDTRQSSDGYYAEANLISHVINLLINFLTGIVNLLFFSKDTRISPAGSHVYLHNCPGSSL
jgi:hypothetical protein